MPVDTWHEPMLLLYCTFSSPILSELNTTQATKGESEFNFNNLLTVQHFATVGKIKVNSTHKVLLGRGTSDRDSTVSIITMIPVYLSSDNPTLDMVCRLLRIT